MSVTTDRWPVPGPAGLAAIVTGAAGFIGSHLTVSLLNRGVRVVGIDSFDRFYAREAKERNLERIATADTDGRFCNHEVDIVDAERLRCVVVETNPSIVFHLAALAGVQPSLAEPGRFVSVNVDGTTNLLEACRASGCNRIVMASSSSVYGDSTPDSTPRPFSEEDRADAPISPYAATKRACELIANVYATTFRMRIACLRYFTVFGPAQRPDLAIMSFMRSMAEGRPITIYGDGASSRDYTYIDDIVDGTIAAAEWSGHGDPCARAFNLGGSQPVALNDLVDAVARTVGVSPRIRRAPGRVGDVQRTWASLERSAAELGYAPKLSLEEGLRRQWAWLESELAVL